MGHRSPRGRSLRALITRLSSRVPIVLCFVFLVESARRPLNFYKVSVTFNDEKHFFAPPQTASNDSQHA